MALSVHRFSGSLRPRRKCAGYTRRESPWARGIVVNRLNPRRTAFLASLIILGTCGAGGQTVPLRDSSVAQRTLAPLSATNPIVRDGLFSIDVVVADSAGKAVSDLEPWDFTLLDNGRPAKIRTVHNSLAASVPAPELIFVLDAVNLSPQQLTQTESAIVHFLGRNNGHLETPCFLYRLTRDGLFSSLRPVKDGALLIKELEQKRSQLAVWRTGRDDGPTLLRAWVNISQPNSLSLRALGSIAIDQRDVPGRKVVVWIGPGWPVNGGENGFDEATELSTRLREARITLDNVDAWPNPNQAFNYHDYLEAPRSQKDMQPAKLALPVIATHTGGLVLDSSGDLDPDINQCAEQVRSFYNITFNPPHTYQVVGLSLAACDLGRASSKVLIGPPTATSPPPFSIQPPPFSVGCRSTASNPDRRRQSRRIDPEHIIARLCRGFQPRRELAEQPIGRHICTTPPRRSVTPGGSQDKSTIRRVFCPSRGRAWSAGTGNRGWRSWRRADSAAAVFTTRKSAGSVMCDGDANAS